MLPQQYCLRWKYHHSNLQTMFSQLLDRGCFCDVTLACEGQIIRAHRVVLCACSTFFDTLLSNYATEPIVIMKDAKFSDVKCLIEFMYKGEINVEHANLASLLKTAEDLKIKGLAEVSWKEDEFDSTIPQEPEQKFQEGSAPISPSKDQGHTDGLGTIPAHRIPRMPLLTPIPSPVHHQDNFGSKRKRGRPPLDDSYDVFSSPKISLIKSAALANNSQSPFRDSPIVVENQPAEDVGENSIPQKNVLQSSNKPGENSDLPLNESNSMETEQQQQHHQQQPNQEWQKDQQNSDDHIEDDDRSQNDRSSPSSTTAAETLNKKQQHSKNNDTIDEFEYYDPNDVKSETIIDDMDGENSLASVSLTTAEIEEWKDVIKMDAYLSRGRRPQFWEEPFTKRVMDAIKSKKLEMKKAAQVLGVSYGTLYGRYRETYGCLKHPYRNQQYYAKRLRGALATIRRCEEVLTVHPDNFQLTQIDEQQQQQQHNDSYIE